MQTDDCNQGAVSALRLELSSIWCYMRYWMVTGLRMRFACSKLALNLSNERTARTVTPCCDFQTFKGHMSITRMMSLIRTCC